MHQPSLANDVINGGIELVGALLLAHNCFLLYRAKKVEGVSVLTTAFFTLWGFWNLYFYPANGLWLSFGGGVALAAANLTWVIMAIYYSRKLKCTQPCPPIPSVPVTTSSAKLQSDSAGLAS